MRGMLPPLLFLDHLQPQNNLGVCTMYLVLSLWRCEVCTSIIATRSRLRVGVWGAKGMKTPQSNLLTLPQSPIKAHGPVLEVPRVRGRSEHDVFNVLWHQRTALGELRVRVARPEGQQVASVLAPIRLRDPSVSRVAKHQVSAALTRVEGPIAFDAESDFDVPTEFVFVHLVEVTGQPQPEIRIPTEEGKTLRSERA